MVKYCFKCGRQLPQECETKVISYHTDSGAPYEKLFSQTCSNCGYRTERSEKFNSNGTKTEYCTPGGCFIATACYGSELDPRLDILRNFRDTTLMPNLLGNMFVKLYYRTSPPIADFIRNKEIIKLPIRKILDYIICKIEIK